MVAGGVGEKCSLYVEQGNEGYELAKWIKDHVNVLSSDTQCIKFRQQSQFLLIVNKILKVRECVSRWKSGRSNGY